MENDFNWPLAIFLVGTTGALMAAVSVLVWQGFATWRARMSVAREEAYRKLAEEATQAQIRIADNLEKVVATQAQVRLVESLEKVVGELAELRKRTAEVERILKEVE
ncbi:MAG: hypothetical protein L0177_12410 [Chloroflexi bacterium]|nr:hypothetical protein [Chloroflexota bacterium]